MLLTVGAPNQNQRTVYLLMIHMEDLIDAINVKGSQAQGVFFDRFRNDHSATQAQFDLSAVSSCLPFPLCRIYNVLAFGSLGPSHSPSDVST